LKILNQTRNTTLAVNARLADTFLSRLVGLLNRSGLPQEEALVITRCQQIHMFFMRFAIDAVFVDRAGLVVGLTEKIQPWQLSAIFWKADRVIELPPGVIAQSQTVLGDRIEFSQ
jgi:uncharacterized protein